MANPFLDANPFLSMRVASNPFMADYGLPQETEDSLLSQLAGGGLSALGFVGNVLDTPGGFVRTALAGENPFPGIFDPSQRTGGRELLEQYGMLGSNTPGLDFGDVAGFAAEVGLDPLTYMTFGASALTKAGKAADAAGTLAKASYGAGDELLQGARAAQMGAGQRGLVGFGLPFMEEFGAVGTGPLAQKIAGGLDTVGDYARFGNPVGLAAGSLFDPTVMGTTTRPQQIAARHIYELEQAAEAAALKQVADVAYPLLEKGGLSGDADDIAARWNFIENDVPLPAHMQNLTPDLLRMREMVGPELHSSQLTMGQDVPILQDTYQKHYGPRLPAQFPDEPIASANQRILDATDPFASGRKEVLRNIPGARDTINQMSMDPRVSGPNAATAGNQLQRAKLIRDEFLGFSDQKLLDENAKLAAMKKELAKATDQVEIDRLKSGVKKQAHEVGKLAYEFKKSFDLADYLPTLDKRHVDEKIGLFPNDPVYDVMKRMVSGHKSMARTQGVYDYLGNAARMVPQPGDVPLLDVVRKAGLGTQTVEQLTDHGASLARAKVFAQEALGTNLEDDALEALADLESMTDLATVDEASKGMLTQLQKAIGDKGDPRFAYVPKEAEQLISKTLKLGMSADSAEPILSFVDKFTNSFKVGVLTWPSRWVRDFYSAAAINAMDGGLSWRGLSAAHQMATKGPAAEFAGVSAIKEFAGMTDKQATTELLKEMFSQKLIQPYGGAWHDIASGRVAGTQVAGELPGGVPQSLKSTLLDPLKEKGAFDPFMTRGIGHFGQIANETRFAPAKISENISHYTDTMARAAPYIEYRLQGLAPEVAAAKVKLAQVDYSDLTAFEKKYMKRLAPFYTFSRKMIPKVIKDLTERPGGRLAQTIRAENLSRDDQFLPPYLAPGLAVRLPESLGPGNGDTRYLTSIDLPHEAVFQLFRPSNTTLGTIEDTGLGLLGQLNPLIKAPMEMATGKQFYSGRDLADLDSRIGRSLNPGLPPDIPILLDQLVANSPFSRVVSMTGTALDPRKGWGGFATNALSGVKISDVDVTRSRDRIARDAIEEMMRGNPAVSSYTSFSVPQDQIGNLTPEEQMLMREYNAIRERSRQRAQENRAPGAGRL